MKGSFFPPQGGSKDEAAALQTVLKENYGIWTVELISPPLLNETRIFRIIFLLFPIYLVHAYFFSNSNLKLSHWYKTLVNVSIWAVYLLCFICVLKKKSTRHLFQNGLNSHFASDVTFTWSVISKFILWHVSLSAVLKFNSIVNETLMLLYVYVTLHKLSLSALLQRLVLFISQWHTFRVIREAHWPALDLQSERSFSGLNTLYLFLLKFLG